jgi:hypothetical protein
MVEQANLTEIWLGLSGINGTNGLLKYLRVEKESFLGLNDN